jgi:ubiquinone/menaquinone biosynthesis C-methylase UbiE
VKRAPLTHDRVFEGEFAAEYARKHRGYAQKFGREVAAQLVQRGFRQGRIIDVGCGFGVTAIVLAQQIPQSEVVGIDLSDPLLQLAEQEAEAAGLSDRVRFEKADVHHIPYENDSFQVVVNVQMLHIVQDPLVMLNEMERVLAPSGHLFMVDIRRSWVGLLDRTFRTGLTLPEAEALVGRSKIGQGKFTSGLLWWRFEL